MSILETSVDKMMDALARCKDEPVAGMEKDALLEKIKDYAEAEVALEVVRALRGESSVGIPDGRYSDLYVDVGTMLEFTLVGREDRLCLTIDSEVVFDVTWEKEHGYYTSYRDSFDHRETDLVIVASLMTDAVTEVAKARFESLDGLRDWAAKNDITIEGMY